MLFRGFDVSESKVSTEARAVSTALTGPSQAPRFGKYVLDKPLGSGGMATVYAARMEGLAGATKRVALKLVHPHLSMNADFVSMFILEMKVAMALQHRNIVQTFDAGLEGGRHFMAMELIDGCSARELLRRAYPKMLPVEIVVFIGMEICEALYHAHTFTPELTGQPGAVIHRDISPSNILVSAAGDVKLADFGVARAMRRLEDTASEIVKGKITYMSPEQARGRACASSDLYSLAAVLYELLGGSAIRAGYSIEELLTPLKLPPLQRQRSDVPAALDELLRVAMAEKVADRPADARAFRRLLAQIHSRLAEQPSEAHGRLRDYLVALPPLPQDSRAAAIGAAMLAQASQVETASVPAQPAAADGRESTVRAAVVAPEQVTVPQRPAASSVAEPGSETLAPVRATRRRGYGVIAVLSFALAAALGAIFLPRSALQPSTRTGVKAPVVARPFAFDASIPLGLADGRPAGSTTADGAIRPRPARLDAGSRRPRRLAGPKRLVGGPSAGRKPSRAAKPRPQIRTRAPKGRPGTSPIAGRGRSIPKVVPATRRAAPQLSQPLGWAELHLNSLPWAQVYLDGRLLGTTPLEGQRVPAGKHRLRLHHPPTGLVQTLELELRAGQVMRKVVRLRRTP